MPAAAATVSHVHHGATFVLLWVQFLSPLPLRFCGHIMASAIKLSYYIVVELIADALLILFYVHNTVQRVDLKLNSH